MGREDLAEDGEIAVPIVPDTPATTTDISDEPPYGWVVCISMHSINAFTWGIIAVWRISLVSVL